MKGCLSRCQLFIQGRYRLDGSRFRLFHRLVYQRKGEGLTVFN